MESSEKKNVDLKRALVDPGSVFEDPQHVLEHPSLSREQKIEILRRWEYDASELAVAEEEGMGGGESTILSKVLRALDELVDKVDVEHSPPTKQRGI